MKNSIRTLIQCVLAITTIAVSVPVGSAQDQGAHARAAVAAARVRRPPRTGTARNAVRAAGRRIFFATGSAGPTTALRELRKRVTDPAEQPVDVFYMSTFASGTNFSAETAARMRPNLMFVSMGNREAATAGHAVVMRDNLHNYATRIEAGELDFDTVFVRVSPPDAEGNVSLGTTGDLTVSAIRQVLARGGNVIAEVNPNVPQTHGTNRIAYNDLSDVYESNEPLPEHTTSPMLATERALVRNIARLMPNRRRSTLQVGIGGAINHLGPAIRGKRIRIWSEMGSDWMLDVMRGDRPAAREATVSFLHGSNQLYSFANQNPRVQVDSSLVVNDPARIAQQTNMFAVNTALEVDFNANTNAEQIGPRLVSSPGGQPNFMQGASQSPTGHAVMALRSTNKFGGSTIVPALSGPLTTTPGNHVDHIVTEWGSTPRLRGLAGQLRRFHILRVAHPAHRPALAAQALAAGLISPQQAARLTRGVFASILHGAVELRTEAANRAKELNLISAEQHAQIIVTVPADVVAEAPPAAAVAPAQPVVAPVAVAVAAAAPVQP